MAFHLGRLAAEARSGARDGRRTCGQGDDARGPDRPSRGPSDRLPGCRLCRALPQAGGHGARSRTAGRRRGRSAFALTAAVAFGYAKLLAYKDEYEVARCSRRPLRAAAWRDLRRQSAPHLPHGPTTARPPGCHGRARKIELGPWLMSAMKLLAKGRRLRGSWLDVFGRSAERGHGARAGRSLPTAHRGPAGEAGSRQPGRRDRARRAAARAARLRSCRSTASLRKVAASETPLVGKFGLEPVFSTALAKLLPAPQNGDLASRL